MPASYNIVPVLQEPDVNPGDSIQVDIYVSGAGQRGRKRLHILHPYPDVFQDNNVGDLITGIELVPEDIGSVNSEITDRDSDEQFVVKPRNEVPDKYKTTNNQDHVGSTIGIPDWFFESVPDDMVQSVGDYRGNVADSFDMKLSEGKFGEDPPLQLTLNIAEDADPGDYEITFLYTYETDIGIKTSRQDLEFHVNDWVEKKQPTLTRIAVATALTGLGIQAIDTLLPWFASWL